MFRGESAVIATVTTATNFVRLGPEVIRVTDANTDLRREIEAHLRRLATQNCPFGFKRMPPNISSRCSASRCATNDPCWGSCSRRAISR